jgi:PPM family protein phosphatase
VADGVGGGPAGDIASATILRRLAASLPGVDDEDDLAVRVRIANWDLRAHIRRHPERQGMATTLTGLFITRAGGLLVAHSGDSRAYRVRDGGMQLMTRDDSLVQALVEGGMLAPADALSHPQRNIVLASLGGRPEDILAVTAVDARAHDRWMICSDGVSDYLPEDAIVDALVGAVRPSDAVGALVALSLEAGSRDNVTAVVADVTSGPVLPDRPVYAGAAAAWFAEELEDTA